MILTFWVYSKTIFNYSDTIMKKINTTSLALAIGTLFISGLLSTASFAEDMPAAPASPEMATPAAPEAAAPAPAAEPTKAPAKKKVKKHKKAKAKKAKAAEAPTATEAAPAAEPTPMQ